jgi:hypothetical protein
VLQLGRFYREKRGGGRAAEEPLGKKKRGVNAGSVVILLTTISKLCCRGAVIKYGRTTEEISW